VLRTFGRLEVEVPDALRPHEQSVRRSAQRARLHCVADPPSIVVGHEAIPVVRAFGPEGDLRWTVSLADFRKVRLEPVPGGRALGFKESLNKSS
jgi:hypothetical protein